MSPWELVITSDVPLCLTACLIAHRNLSGYARVYAALHLSSSSVPFSNQSCYWRCITKLPLYVGIETGKCIPLATCKCGHFLLPWRDEMPWHTYKEFMFHLSSSACWWDQDWSKTSALMTAYLGLWQILFLPLWLKNIVGSHCPAEQPQSHKCKPTFSHVLDQTNFYTAVCLEKQQTECPPCVLFGATPLIRSPALN